MLISMFACLGACNNTESEAPTPSLRYNPENEAYEISFDGGVTWTVIENYNPDANEPDNTPDNESETPGVNNPTNNPGDAAAQSYEYPVETVVPVAGTVAYGDDHVFKIHENTKTAFIALEGLDYDTVSFDIADDHVDPWVCFAFLTEMPEISEVVSYADGYDTVKSYEAAVEIPEDAKYLVVYYLDDYDELYYPGAIIELEGTMFNTVTMKKNASGEPITYAFMGDELYFDFTPCYAAGYTKLVSSTEDTVTVRIPDNARYLYVYNNKSSTMYLPSEIKFTKETYAAENPNSVRIATWNIGHFSMGKKPNSTLEDTQVAMMAADFNDYINNAIDADIMFLNEYSKKFTKNTNLAKDTIFTEYDTVYEGTQLNYSCNAVYSRIEISEPEMHVFECNKTAGTISTKGPLATDYYFVTTDLVINGTTIKLVSAHLAFDGEGSENVVVNQIYELIDYCEDYEHVVLLGDWNVNYFSEFELFTEAGYSLGNTDENMSTYNDGVYSLDNIVYKGVTVTDFTLAGTNLSDHYAVYCTITVDE